VTAIVLAAGYATRLSPLTDACPKSLLPVAGKPVIEYVLDVIGAAPEVENILLVVNERHHDAFRDWLRLARVPRPVALLNDGTCTNGERLGSTGDLRFALERTGLDDDFLLLPSDRILGFSLDAFCRDFRRRAEALNACQDLGNPEAVRLRHGCVVIAPDGRIVDLEEKPATPRSSIASIAVYAYPRSCIPLVSEFLRQGGDPDAPGHFARWYLVRQPLYAFLFTEECHDIGTIETYRAVDELFRRRAMGPASGA
jgi:glucose-1-phosphate thymidylyltransferase